MKLNVVASYRLSIWRRSLSFLARKNIDWTKETLIESLLPSMTTLFFDQSIIFSQPTEYKFLLKKDVDQIVFWLDLASLEYKSTKIRPIFFKKKELPISKVEVIILI